MKSYFAVRAVCWHAKRKMCWWLSCICFLCWYPVISFSGFKRNQWSWGPFATEIFPSPFGTSLGPAIWWDYIWRNRRLNSLHVPWWEGHTLWDTVARSPQSLWTTHLRLLSIKDISSQYWSGHISSKWHFVNRERRKKKKALIPVSSGSGPRGAWLYFFMLLFFIYLSQ